jgi:molecular chaperone Hsp33
LSDTLIRATIPDHHLRVVVLDSPKLTQEICKLHCAKGLAAEILGKAIGAGLLCSPLLEGKERYTMRWQYSGEVGTLLVDVAAQAKVRAVPERSELSSEDPKLAYGEGGKLGVVKSNARGRLNSGMSLADRQDPAQDLATYFDLSDQLPSSCHCWTDNQGCQGILIQGLPGANREFIADMDEKIPSIKDRFFGEPQHLEQQLQSAFDELFQSLGHSPSQLSVHETREPLSFCNCSKQKMLDMLRSISEAELEDMIKKDGGAQIDCQFCNHTIRLDVSDLQGIIDDKKSNREN